MDTCRIHVTSATASSEGPLILADRVVLALATLGLLGTALLGNPAAPVREWPAGSVLQHIVWAVSLGYRLPTLRGVEAKTLLVSLLSGILLIWATLRTLRGRLELFQDLPEAGAVADRRVGAATLSLFAVGMLLIWALLSAFWSCDASTAIGSTWVLSLGWLWAAGFGLHGHRRLVRPMTDVLLAAASVTAALSLWYGHERAVEARLSWPLGNPLSLASVMVPTVLVAAGRLFEQLASWSQPGHRASVTSRIGIYAVIGGGALATLLATGSRGPLLAVAIGAVAGLWVAVPSRQRLALALTAAVVLTLAIPAAATWLFTAGGGRDASARMRVYAWRDALQLGITRPAAGHGAGAYCLQATGLSARDCVVDPLAMSGEVSTHAHSEPLELLADLGVFGTVVGLAIWGFAAVGAAGRSFGADRWLAASLSGAIVAALIDASTGVSWRLPGPAPFLAMPVAMAWMLCREAVPSTLPVRSRRIGVCLVPSLVGIAVAAAGIADFAAARFLYRAQSVMQQAERALLRSGSAAATGPAQDAARQAGSLAGYALSRADQAARWHMDPARKLVARLAGGQMRGSLGYLPLLSGASPGDLQAGQKTLDEGLAILRYLDACTRPAGTSADYADTYWLMSELLGTKASLSQAAHDPQVAVAWRQQSLGAALQYFGSRPLDHQRIRQAFGIWPEIPPAQRLSLSRGTLREEGEVWRRQESTVPVSSRWTQQREYVARLWWQLGEPGQGVVDSFMEQGYSALRAPYAQWQDPLAPEGVWLVAVRQVLQGQPAQAADALEMAGQLYEQAGGLLPYSQAAVRIDLAACRIRQGSEQFVLAEATLAEARHLLTPLPDNSVRRQLLELAKSLEESLQAVAGAGTLAGSGAWRLGVELFWDMPPATWPGEIDTWARRADGTAAEQVGAGPTQMQLEVARGEADTARRDMQRMLSVPGARIAVQAALREAGYRWPARQDLVAALLQEMDRP
jgi:O-antigen ligase